MSLSDLMNRLERREDIGGRLVITFDDGYRDNHAVAAPILRKLQLPCCFFIATNLIESTTVPWWDERLPFTPEWMSWNQVRSLRAQGFEIGAHTMNHVDLGVVDIEEARSEIAGSREALARQLGEAPVFFSYPYGRSNQITEESRTIVREQGFTHCLSAYGGAVLSGEDPLRVRRVPISPWYRSTYQFGLETLML